MRDPSTRAGEFHRPVVRADVERRDSLNLGVLERAGPRPDCAGKSAGGNDGTALVSDSEGSAVELATTGALYADVESKDLSSRDRRRDVPGIDMNVVWFDPAAGIGTGSPMGDAVAVGGHQHSAVSVFTGFDRGGDGDLCAEIVTLEGCERRFANFMAGRVEEQDRITRKIVLFGTFRHGFEGQRSAGIGFLGRNRQAQEDREKNGFLTIHG
jgi:hypothetical protein